MFYVIESFKQESFFEQMATNLIRHFVSYYRKSADFRLSRDVFTKEKRNMFDN